VEVSGDTGTDIRSESFSPFSPSILLFGSAFVFIANDIEEVDNEGIGKSESVTSIIDDVQDVTTADFEDSKDEVEISSSPSVALSPPM
jgi:hypothetical protein